MNQLEQKPGPKWWKETEGYRAYHLREYSGVLIATWSIFYLGIPEKLFGLALGSPYYTWPLHAIGLIGAIIHASTWLGIMPKLLPVKLNERQQNWSFIFLIVTWLGTSGLLIKFLWM